MFGNMLDYNEGLQIEVRTIIVGKHCGIKYLPSLRGSSPVAAIGISGVAVAKRGQKIINLMNLGDFIRKVISWKKCRFKKEKDSNSLNLYHAYQHGEGVSFGFIFTVKDGDYLQKALFTVTPSKFIEYQTNANPVAQINSRAGLEAIEFEFETANVDYATEINPMFLYRVKEQQKKIINLVSRQ